MFTFKYVLCFTILSLLAAPVLAQENTTISCADGVDNDGDGLIDCEDDDCQTLPHDGCSTCGEGITFADEVLEYSPGGNPFSSNHSAALGVSNWTGAFPSMNEYVSLGESGNIKLAFTNNLLTNSGDASDDLWIFEAGSAELSRLALRPANAFTEAQLQMLGITDSNMDGFYDVGNVLGTDGFDIDIVLPGYAAGTLLFDAISITDGRGGLPDSSPGPDIDAVCAISSVDLDCAGVVNGTSVLDDCGECLAPDDPAFNQSCTDCAGVVNGTSVLDDCGECLAPDDPAFNQSCTDCAGVVNGTSVLDDCGECLAPDDPAFNQSCTDCAGVVNGTSVLDDCGECLATDDPAFNQSCTDCAGVVNGSSVLDDCGECLAPDDPAFNQSCTDCAGVVNGTSVLDDCGECLAPDDPAFNQSCTDCAGVVNGTSVLDDCGECLAPDDPAFNQSCTDCAGVVNGTSVLDDCGECLAPDDPAFNQSCTDCAGVVNGSSVLDDCGECLAPDDPAFNQSCTDCAGVVKGTSVLDDCGECLAPDDLEFNQSCTDCAGVVNGTLVLDDCGECLAPDDPAFNQSCTDCAGVVNGTSVLDDCGECLAPDDPAFNQSCAGNVIYMPNAFSPNGDGLNDRFELFGRTALVRQVRQYMIYNRWGELVYYASNFDMNAQDHWWDGSLNGKVLPPATFVYKIEVEFMDGEVRSYQGSISLIR
ncbi:gliding motility-associated C-terminal domain-containing protein [Catalinimonas sp. 4WD22]|uniref:gliding motility-associated C-terminal domain-containing protein n=1 Tax=Catalinimonas locisalis TaxID=3133978 RepID=UPI003100E950